MKSIDVLIVGAGPTGLVLALWLTSQGVAVRIVDKTAGAGTTSRALAVQARTLELYRQLDLAEDVVQAGMPNPGINLWVRGRRRAHIAFGEAGATLTPYPFVLIFPQDRHESLLVERLQALGVTVERNTELLDFEQRGDGVVARLRGPDGREQRVAAQYLAGCDGARSPVRHRMGTGFEGGTYGQVFYVADVRFTGLAAGGEIHIALDQSDFVALFSYSKDGRGRLIGTVREERAFESEELAFADVSARAIAGLGLQVEEVSWFSTYKVHHRVAERYRDRRVFLLGDAAHIHSPAGGQGMNTGIGDAINLAWKIKAVLRGEAPDGLLDSYETERQAFAKTLVDTTDRVFSFVSAEGGFADFVRTRIAPLFVSAAYSVDAVREFMFRVVSQTMLNYHESAVSGGGAGRIKGGDRLPWVHLEDGTDNMPAGAAIDWQVHVYGAAASDLRAWCDQEGILLSVFGWDDAMEAAGLQRNAAYLLRPDSYVALAEAGDAVASLRRYFAERGYRRFTA